MICDYPMISPAPYYLHHLNGYIYKEFIEYYVSPLLGIQLHWVTEITHVEHLKYFIRQKIVREGKENEATNKFARSLSMKS